MPINYNLLNTGAPAQIAGSFMQGFQQSQDRANMLAQQERQNKLADMQYQELLKKQQAEEAKRNAYNQAKSPSEIPAALRAQGLGEEAFGVESKMATEEAARNKAKLEAAKTSLELMKNVAGQVLANPTLEYAIQSTQKFGQITGSDVTADIAELTRMGNNPEAIRQWAAGHAVQADKLLPQFQKLETNEAIVTGTTDPITGKFTPNVSYKQGVSPNTRYTQEQENARAAANRKAAMDRVVKAQENNQLDPGAIDFLAEQVNAGDTSVLSGLARSKGAVAAVRNRAAELARAEGLTPADITANRVALTGDLAGSRTLGTTLANVSAAASEAEKMIAIAETYVPKINPTNYPVVNAAGNYVARQTGDPIQAGLATSLNSLVNAYARAINPKGVATVSDKTHAREIVNAAMSQGQFAEVFNVMRLEMQAAQAAPKEIRSKMRDGEKLSTLTGKDKQALDWANANPTDPRAAKIKATLGAK